MSKQVFGKRLSEYIAFEKVSLALIAVVGLARLGLSLAGLPDTTVRWLSMNVVIWAGAIYYGVVVYTRGFGSYRQLLPLMFFPFVILHTIAVTGILLTIFGMPNVFAAPEYSGPVTPDKQWLHILAHLTIGMVVAPLLTWAVASLAMRITKSVARRPAVA
jgi:hypothetical protein